jgi:hypothetical protein
MTSSEKEKMDRMKAVNAERDRLSLLDNLINSAQTIKDGYNDDELSWNDVRDAFEDLRSELSSDGEDNNGWYVRRWMRINLKGN